MSTAVPVREAEPTAVATSMLITPALTQPISSTALSEPSKTVEILPTPALMPSKLTVPEARSIVKIEMEEMTKEQILGTEVQILAYHQLALQLQGDEAMQLDEQEGLSQMVLLPGRFPQGKMRMADIEQMTYDELQ